nr:hypothetical protein [uncultured Desulfobacter sp.]
MTKIGSPWSFTAGYVQDKDTCFFVGQFDDVEESAAAIKWDLKQKDKYLFDIFFDATQFVVLQDEGFVTGIDGTITVFDVKKMYGPGQPDEDEEGEDEEIDDSDNGVKVHGDIRELRVINENLYAVGMGRQIYRREGKNHWTHQDYGILDDPTNTKSVFGLNSMDAIGDTMCAAGFGGEIWWRKNDIWVQMDSPTNVILNKVKAVKNIVYICGKGGVLLKGNEKNINVVEHNSTEDEFWSLEYYQDTIYAATRKNVYMLKNNDLIPVKMGLGDDTSCGFLHANDGILMSVGTKDICITKDGKTWEDITPRYKQKP